MWSPLWTIEAGSGSDGRRRRGQWAAGSRQQAAAATRATHCTRPFVRIWQVSSFQPSVPSGAWMPFAPTRRCPRRRTVSATGYIVSTRHTLASVGPCRSLVGPPASLPLPTDTFPATLAPPLSYPCQAHSPPSRNPSCPRKRPENRVAILCSRAVFAPGPQPAPLPAQARPGSDADTHRPTRA